MQFMNRLTQFQHIDTSDLVCLESNIVEWKTFKELRIIRYIMKDVKSYLHLKSDTL